MLDELATTTIVAKTHCFYLSIFVNISCIPSSFEDEELELFDLEVLELSLVELEPWFEDEAMISK
jgi:hypothetical protein